MSRFAYIGAVTGLLLAGCSGDSSQRDVGAPDRTLEREAAAVDLQQNDTGEDPTCLGTKYPGKGTIDPDNPDFEDALWTKEEVQNKFAAAKAQDLPAYHAYRAASRASAVLECAFCACGCATSDAHLSAIDCFKDMHGFG